MALVTFDQPIRAAPRVRDFLVSLAPSLDAAGEGYPFPGGDGWKDCQHEPVSLSLYRLTLAGQVAPCPVYAAHPDGRRWTSAGMGQGVNAECAIAAALHACLAPARLIPSDLLDGLDPPAPQVGGGLVPSRCRR